MKGNLTRRGWLSTSAAGAAGFYVSRAGPGAGSPNDKVGVGLIGCGERSSYAAMYDRHAHAKVVAVCDPVRERRERRAAEHGNAAAFRDFRELLAHPGVDAVHIATPDHWHVPIALAAARAGKDMYVEKPLGLCLEQTRSARAIVDRHHRVFQYGAQQRSITHVRLGLELALNGCLGEVRQAVVWAPHGEAGGSSSLVLPVPEGFDYDLWLGPAPEAPFCADRCLTGGGRKGIYHIRDYALGFIAGWGSHPMDMLQWWADNSGRESIPTRYEGTGVIPSAGLFDTLTHWDLRCAWADGFPLRFMDNATASKWADRPEAMREKCPDHGTLLIGSEGWVLVHRGGWKTSSESLRQKARDAGPVKLPVSHEQIFDFVDRVRDRGRPVDHLHSAVRSDMACHLGEIAIRTGRPIQWDSATETVVGDAGASKLLSRPMRAPWTLG